MQNLLIAAIILLLAVLTWFAAPLIPGFPGLAFGVVLGLMGGIPAALAALTLSKRSNRGK